MNRDMKIFLWGMTFGIPLGAAEVFLILLAMGVLRL